MSGSEPLSTKEALLSHIYALINEQEPTLAGKITGMFADSTVSHLMQLLGDPQLLQTTIQKASKSIEIVTQSNQDKTDLGDALFSKVSTLETSLCAQITGMLLELDRKVLKHLLEDPGAMMLAVSKARDEYVARVQVKPADADKKVSDTTGEKIYLAVSTDYPRNAGKITGMLTELSEDYLLQLLNDSEQLKAKIDVCRTTLESTGLWIIE